MTAQNLDKHIDWLRKKITSSTYTSHDEDDELMCVILEMELKRQNINLTIQQVNTIVNLKRSISHHLGDFWQKILGDTPGWRDLGIGDTTGCDLINEENMIVIELKNRMSTMNSSSKSAVFSKLQKQQEYGYTGVLGIINGNPKKSVDKRSGVTVATGEELFKIVCGNTNNLFTDVMDAVKRLWIQQDDKVDALATEFMQKALINE